MATQVADDHGVRAITVDGPAFHNLGANATWELAGSIAAAVSYLRVLTEAGLPVAKALSQISFRAGRRRRPVLDDREGPGVASAVGAGG